MGFFKRLRSVEAKQEEYDARFANLATSMVKLGKQLEELKEKLPDYDEAVARGVEEVWNKALSEVANYDPLAFGKKENAAE